MVECQSQTRSEPQRDTGSEIGSRSLPKMGCKSLWRSPTVESHHHSFNRSLRGVVFDGLGGARHPGHHFYTITCFLSSCLEATSLMRMQYVELCSDHADEADLGLNVTVGHE